MVATGMSPAETIRAATVIGSENIRMQDQIGTIEAGKLADIIAVKGDPLEDVTLLENSIAFVMKDGKVFKNE